MTIKQQQGVYAPVSSSVATGTTETAVPVATATTANVKGASPKQGMHKFNVGAAEEPTVTWTKGEVQEPGYKDKYFAIAFLLQLVAVIVTGLLFAVGAIEQNNSNDDNGMTRRLDDSFGSNNNNYNYNNNFNNQDRSKTDADDTDTAGVIAFLGVVVIAVILAPILSVLTLGLMKEHAIFLIQFSLWFIIGFNVFLVIVTLVLGAPGASIIYAIVALIMGCYFKAVHHRIPYAASNLRSAITAIKANLGIALLSFAAVPVRIGWYVMWFYTLYCTLQTDFMKQQVEDTTDEMGNQEEQMSAAGSFVIILFLLSLYWTSEVIKNTIHTTVAGVIGTWWFLPEEASSFCSKGLTDSLARSTTYSFGSICLGSLIVAILELLKNFLRSARNNRNGGLLRCIAYCLLVWIERLAEYFNKWAFIYVGLYGYSYVEAGKNVLTLFRARGWSTIISDNLVYRMLGVMCLAIGFIVALVGVVFALATGETDGGFLVATSFVGLIVGAIMSGIMMGAVGSAVDAIIVLYAEAPAEFEENHPQLAHEMQATWSAAWGDVFTPHAEVVPDANVV